MLVKYKSFKVSRHFGVELEFGNQITRQAIRSAINLICDKEVSVTEYQQSRGNNYWHVKQDSTCGPKAHINPDGRDYGVELASYKASGLRDITHISTVAGSIRSIGVEVNQNCGFHIHAEAADFTPEQCGILLARWMKIEPVMAMMTKASRTNNKHCKLWRATKKISFNTSYTGSELWERCKPHDLKPYDNDDKRVALNFVNYTAALRDENRGHPADRKTVELRLPESTLNSRDISNWIKVYLLFVDNSRNAQMPSNLDAVKNLEEFFSYLGLASHDDSFFLLSKGMNSTKNWVLSKIVNSETASASRATVKYWHEAKDNLALIWSANKKEKIITIPEYSVSHLI